MASLECMISSTVANPGRLVGKQNLDLFSFRERERSFGKGKRNN